uniref:Serpin domain-containing protein n=1 Tax=Leptobrachium leishanense TaxID=445787 RepID=A0A8C5PNJ2_9ANUR
MEADPTLQPDCPEPHSQTKNAPLIRNDVQLPISTEAHANRVKHNQNIKNSVPRAESNNKRNDPVDDETIHSKANRGNETETMEVRNVEEPTDIGNENKTEDSENEMRTTESIQGTTPTYDVERCPPSWPECAADSIANATKQVTRAMTSFSVELYKILSKYNTDTNLVVAPVSIALALSHLMLGTGQKTRDIMLRNLFKGVTDTQCVHEAITNLFNKTSFLSASEIFYRKDMPLNEAYVKQSLKYYGSHGIELKNNLKESLKQINKWISSKTNNNIPEFLENLPSDLQLLLVNVIYYQGKWLAEFDSKLTKKESFNIPGTGPVKVTMMNSHKYHLQFLIDKHLKAQVARFPLSNNISFIVILPHTSETVETVAKRLTEGVISILVNQLQEVTARSTSVSLPRMKLDSSSEMTELLSRLDLNNLFDNPDLCSLSTESELFVNEIHHRAVLKVTEDGVAAAAASAVSVARTMSFFMVRKPFIFILASDITTIPIFIGHVNDPTK